MSTAIEARPETVNPELQNLPADADTLLPIYDALQIHDVLQIPLMASCTVTWEEVEEGSRMRTSYFAAPAAWVFASELFSARNTRSESLVSEIVTRAINRICREASDYQFEDGMISPFEIELRKMVFRHENIALEALRDFIESGSSNTVAAEALRIIGDIKEPSTRPYRKWLLEKYLQHRSTYIRDGAIIGLLHLDDPATLPQVEAAIETETSFLLKEDLQQLSDQLKATQNATTQVRS